MTAGHTFDTDLVARFNESWNAHDLDAALAMVTDDCVFEATSPPPDGTRCVGKEAIAEAWRPIFADQSARFSVEDTIVGNEHVVQLWIYDWGSGHVRGVDVIRISEGKIAAKLSYVKG